jgi:hypothetical protein
VCSVQLIITDRVGGESHLQEVKKRMERHRPVVDPVSTTGRMITFVVDAVGLLLTIQIGTKVSYVDPRRETG